MPVPSPLDARLDRRSVLRGIGGMIGLGLLGGGLSACGGGSGGSSATSGGLTGEISFLNYEGWIGTDTIKDFEAAHAGASIKEVTSGGAFESVVAKLKAQPGLYDMALASIDGVGRGLKLGVIETMDFSRIPNTALIEPTFLGTPVNADGDHFIPTDYGKVGIGIRRDLVSDTIESWADLWAVAPKYRGKLYAYDYSKDLMGTGLLVSGYKPNDVDPDHIRKAGAALEQLKPSIGTLGTSGIGSSLVNGDAALAITYDYEVYSASLENADVEWVAPAEGMTGYLEGWVALKGTRSLELIEAFADFHLQADNYASFVTRNDIAYVEAGLGDTLSAELSKSPILFPPADVLATVTFEQYLGDAEALYDQAYTKFQAS